MATKKPQITFTVTHEQRLAIRAAAGDADKSISDFIRDAIGVAVEAQGYGWVDNMPVHGNMRLTDYRKRE